MHALIREVARRNPGLVEQCEREERRAAQRRMHPGFVYFVGEDEPSLIKIGWAKTSVEKRVRQLQTGSPLRLRVLATIVGSRLDEKKLHRRFFELHSHGEWFRAAPELLASIRSFAQGTEPA